jgi:anaerobic selenocysteine-containing dehydrogenase
MIAAELAARIGEDLGFDSLHSLWAEVERLAPSYRGLTQATLSRPEHRDGIVVPPNPDDLARVEAADSGMRPVEAVEVRAVATQSFTGSDIQPVPPEDEPAAADASAASEPPPILTWTAPTSPVPPPPVDAYSLRLVSGRKLYDAGVVVQHCPSLAHLTPGARLGVNPFDLDRLGLHTGDRAKATSARGSAVFEVQVDEGVPRGSASLTFNQPGDASPSSLIDVTQPVTELRVETV